MEVVHLVELNKNVAETFNRLKQDVEQIAKEPWVHFDKECPREEGYKTQLREYALTRLNSTSWTREQIGMGFILDAVNKAIEITEKMERLAGATILFNGPIDEAQRRVST